jgi:hypothetical protein
MYSDKKRQLTDQFTADPFLLFRRAENGQLPAVTTLQVDDYLDVAL